jgi:hypothetical protein
LFEVRHGLVVVILIGAILVSLCVAAGVRELARRKAIALPTVATGSS